MARYYKGNFQGERLNFQDWWRVVNRLPKSEKIDCPYAKVNDKERAVGSIIYEKGDVICDFLLGAKSILYPTPDVCILRGFKEINGELRGVCPKFKKEIRIKN